MEMEVASIEEVVDNGSDTDVDVDDSSSPTAVPHLSSAQLLMQATRAQGKPPALQHNRPKGKLVAVTAPKTKTAKQPNQSKPTPKQATLIAQAVKQANFVTQVLKQNAVQTVKVPAKPAPTPPPKPSTSGVQQTKANTPPPKPALISQAAKQAALMAQSAKQASVIAQLTKQTAPKANLIQTKQLNVVKQPGQSPKLLTQTVAVKPTIPQPVVKQLTPQPILKQEPTKISQIQKTFPPTVPTPSKSPLIKQRPLQKQPETSQISVGSFGTSFFYKYICFMRHVVNINGKYGF